MSTNSDPDLPPSRRQQLFKYGPIIKSSSYPKNDLTISPLRNFELSNLSKLYMKAYRGMEEYGEYSTDKAARYLWQLFRSCPRGFFKAEMDGKIVGFIACDPDWYELGHQKVLEVHELVVDPDWQSFGLGRRLMNFAIEVGQKLGRGVISLWAGEGNRKALSWYTSKLGFNIDRRAGKWIHLHKQIDDSGFN